MSGQRLLLALAQVPVSADPAANGAAIRATMREAAAGGARLFVTPECALSGQPGATVAIDWPLLEAELRAVAALAAELALWTVVGTVQPPDGDRRPTNSLIVLSDRGEAVGRYDKRVCSFRESRDLFAEGERPLVFEAGGFRIGCALCIEIHFPELFAEYERLEADVVLLPAYSRDPVFLTLARAQAEMTCQWVALATPADCGDRLPSALIGPNGQVGAQAPAAGGPALVLAALDRADPAFEIALTKARPWRRARRARGPLPR